MWWIVLFEEALPWAISSQRLHLVMLRLSTPQGRHWAGISAGPSMLPIKTGSGNRLRHWPAGQQFGWLCSCSPALSCLVPSCSFPNCEGTIQSTACARDHPQHTLGTAATGKPQKTQSQLHWGSHMWTSEKILSYFVLEISWLLSFLQQKIALYTVVFWHIQF